ncbi:MAG: hypothetical protein GY816_18020 [Cytophagales bacterium]|nr:hypothetical protein [Cytophagales bacterium]
MWGTGGGGINGNGVIFHIEKDGSSLTKVHDFNGTNGSSPVGFLIFSNNKLWGATKLGGTNDVGTIFSINPNGTGFTSEYSFSSSESGQRPIGDLTEYDSKLWVPRTWEAQMDKEPFST